MKKAKSQKSQAKVILQKSKQTPGSDFSIGQSFQKYRMKRGLSVSEVASMSGLSSESLLAKYEAGDRLIPLNDLFALGNALNVPPDELLGWLYEYYRQSQGN